jgi:hypothetical protein
VEGVLIVINGAGFRMRVCEIGAVPLNKSCESSNLPLRAALHLKPDHQGGLHAQRDWHFS